MVRWLEYDVSVRYWTLFIVDCDGARALLVVYLT